MRHHARLLLRFPSETARAIEGALLPETLADVGRSSVEVSREGDALRIDLHADDLPGLRAALNGQLRALDAAARAARLGI